MSQVGSAGAGRQGDRCDHRADVGFVNVGTHPGDVTHIVADVISDDAGIAWIVFGNAGFNLADQIGTDISGFGEDAAAHPGEQGDGGRAHRKAPDTGNGLRIDRELGGQPGEKQAQPDQAETGDRQAHHRATVEGHQQRLAGAVVTGGGGGADIGLGGGFHADQPGQRRGQRARQKRNAGAKSVLFRNCQQNGDHQGENTYFDVLGTQISHRAQLYFFADSGHQPISGGTAGDRLVEHCGGGQPHQASQQRQDSNEHKSILRRFVCSVDGASMHSGPA